MNSQSGRAVDSLIELLVILLVVPPLVCCALQVLVTLLGAVLPWVLLLTLVVGVFACLGAGIGTRQLRVPPPIADDPPARVPPVRRPPGIIDRRRERRNH